MITPPYKRKRFWLSIILGLAVMGFMLHKANFKIVYENLRNISIVWIFLSFLCAVISYTSIAAILNSLLLASGYQLKPRDVLSISLISTVANYVINLVGISGLAVKIYLMSRRKVLPSHTLAISIIHGFFTNTIAIFFIFVGLIVFYGHCSMESKPNKVELTVTSFMALLFGAFIWLAIFIVNDSFRQKNWLWFTKIYDHLSKKIKYLSHKKAELEIAFNNFNTSMNFIVKNMKQLIYASIYALIDWLFMFGCLKTSFMAVHCPVNFKVLIMGFCVSLFISIISIVPGGLGIMEGSMVSVFYLLGLEYEQSLIAVIIYRLIYYLIPIIIGLIMFLKDFSLEHPEEVKYLRV